MRLESDRPGVLERIAWWADRPEPPGPGEIQVRVAAAGLNFLDVLTALDAYPGRAPGRALLGREFAGVVTAVGDGVAGLAVGDTVLGCGTGSLATHVTTPAELVARVPEGLDLQDAAGVGVAFATAQHALSDLASVRRGERVLIHSAAGGTGLAALQVARRLGAQVLATAGSEDKRSYLRSLGVEHVWSSRSGNFARGVMKVTGDRGVDVVLNTLSGPLAARSRDVLGRYGRFVELSKRDIYDEAALDLAPFSRSLSFYAVDMAALLDDRPSEFRRLLEEVAQLLAVGELTPLPTTVLPASAVRDAFATMAKGEHIGKIVVELGDVSDVPVVPRARIRPDATYLVSGGLGGIGLLLASWLVDQGASSIVLASRGDPGPAACALMNELASRGTTIRAWPTNVADATQVERLVERIASELPPLRGVFHAAAVLDDRTLVNTQPSQAAAVLEPKVAGAWNLHQLTSQCELDCFVLFSSAASMLGSPGQGAYAAGNAYLDALAHYRREHGLPALSVNWGPWADVGLAAAKENRGPRLGDRGMASVDPDRGLALLGRLLEGDAVQIGVLALDLRQWGQFYPTAAAAPVYSDLTDAAHASARETGPLRQLVKALAADRRRAAVEEHVRAEVAAVLRLNAEQVSTDIPFNSLGVDSLMAMELRNRLETSSGIKLSTTIVWAYPTVKALAGHLEEALGLPAEATEEPQESFAARVAAMSDSEAEKLLLARLADVAEGRA